MHEWIIIACTLAVYFVFSAAVGAMLPPTPEQNVRFYGWLYRFLQRLAANADRLAEARFGNLAGFPHHSDHDRSPDAVAASGVPRS